MADGTLTYLTPEARARVRIDEMLTAAGANYFMDVALNTDRMLAEYVEKMYLPAARRQPAHRQAVSSPS